MLVKATCLVGLDVHARQTHAAILRLDSGELAVSKLRMAPGEVVDVLERLGPGVVAVYEAGPTGFGLARTARGRAIDVRVVAPGSIPKGSGDRVKTDRRDAIRLVRLLAAGELTFAFVPSVQDEHFRDLVRCIEDIRGDLMRARHRLGKFLLRRGCRYEGGGAWTGMHMRWLRALSFEEACSQATFVDYLAAVELLVGRRPDADRGARTPDPRVLACRGDRAAAVLSRDRHAVGRRRRRRGRQLRPLPKPTLLSGFLGIVPSDAPPTPSAGKDRSPRPGPLTPAGAGRSRPPLPLPTPDRRRARPPPERAGPSDHRDRLARAATPARPLAAPARAATQARRRRRDRRLPRTRRVPPGGRHPRCLTATPTIAPGTLPGRAQHPGRPITITQGSREHYGQPTRPAAPALRRRAATNTGS